MIEFHLCTISFRHHLVSLAELAQWASEQGFDGLELWGIHARHLAQRPGVRANEGAIWLAERGLRVAMISDYLPLEGDESVAMSQTQRACELARHWGASKIRTFAGRTDSHQTSAAEREQLVQRLRRLAECTADAGLTLVVETHPDTLADTVTSTQELMQAVDHPALGVNLDVLHVWEAGDDPLVAMDRLQPWIRHCHFKNIARRSQLGVFAPDNVYSPAGTREGMVPVMEGACDYRPVLQRLRKPRHQRLDVSLEWFGGNCHQVLSGDLARLRSHLEQPAATQAELACQ
ncbi:MAG TPA: sugar phosphate isomerase/epimerase family protein [Marinobacter sp.]|nr:sugar phosphate isomerase/epimerase family protein [Marinobacter sp.]